MTRPRGQDPDPLFTCPFIVEVLRAGIPPGATVVDLGAHVGTFALPAAALGYRVLAVEASPRNAVQLQQGARERGLDVRVVQAAISDGTGTRYLLEDGPWSRVVDGPSVGAVEVPCLTLDGLLERLGVTEVAFVKLDVEGSEPEALRGMSALLSRPDPPALLVESNGPRLAARGSSPQALVGMLRAQGYRCFLAHPGRLVPADSRGFQPSCVVDYLAVGELCGPWRRWIEPPMSLAEIAARVVAECRSPRAEYRAWVADALECASPQVRSHPDVAAALAEIVV